MTADSARGALILVLPAAALPVAAHGEDAEVQNFQIHIGQPVYSYLPVSIAADLRYPLDTHHPAASDDPDDLGPNRLEKKRDGQVPIPRDRRYELLRRDQRGREKLSTVDC